MTDQRTEEWYQQRLGKVTASRVADVVAKTRTGYSASRNNYMAELIVERLTQQPASNYTNTAMQWGIDNEDDARSAYEFINNCNVELVGFVPHPTIKMSGASPDGRVGDDGLVEIKCPNTATHIDTLLTSKIPDKYIKQMQWQMHCDGRQWCDYVSYDPRLPIELSFWQARIDIDCRLIAEMYTQVTDFLIELDEKLNKLIKIKEAA